MLSVINFEWPLLLAIVVAVLMAFFAQVVIRLTMRHAQRLPARMSGFAAARKLLDDAGLENVAIEQVPGSLSNHYEPLHRVLRLSEPVYHGRSLAAVGIATHEVGHALQHAAGDFRVKILGLAGVIASFGSGAGIVLLMLGVGFRPLIWLGAYVFCGAVFFQIANLPGELNASHRAKKRLLKLEIVADEDYRVVLHVINAATLTYLAVTLQTVLSSLIRLLRYMSRPA